MSNKEKDASERAFQEFYVNELKKYKWSAPSSLNGNLKRVTVDDLVNNWRKELNRLNADQLEGVELTDNEFKQIIAKVNKLNNSYEAAKLLAMEDSKGKIDGIFRDDNNAVTRKQITLTIFKKAEVSGGDSSYQIAREIVTPNGNRFDIVMLINGLPLINIELKRTDKTLDDAFGQFARYYREGEFINNFMAFSQMMVVSSEIETRYFATPKSYDAFNPYFEFHWSDRQNNPINNWQEVIKEFLMIPMAHQMVGDYLVIDEEKNEEDQKHMLMRPYQVYALQAIEGAAFGWDNFGTPHGGFVWHTTGSGKTITSFKTALFLSTRAGYDKIVFLVDRKDLDKKTRDNFHAYSKYESVSVDDTKHTYQLRNIMKSSKKGIVVTTTFKLNSLVKEMIENDENPLKEKRIIFIIDEAHRTTMGGMMLTITKFFRLNGLFYGFTGTPLFSENRVKGMINENSEEINTTEKLFGKLLHKYTIDSAIADGNVLGFHIDYINTGEFKSYEELREKLIERDLTEHPDKSKRDIEREIQSLGECEVERRARNKEILVYQDKTHIPLVVKNILDNWDSQSQEREFNAILTVAYKKRVIEYYKEFKKQLKDRNKVINIAITFSSDDENDIVAIPQDVINEMYQNYASYTSIEYDPNNHDSEEAYLEDLTDRAIRGGSGRNPKNIDLIIVADRLLTGFDSKRLNTLYVDRTLELQGLIQAYSRTNRVYGKNKEFGSIINFQFPRLTKEAVDKALILYGSGGKNSKIIVDTYENAVRKLKTAIEVMVESLPTPSDWQSIKNNVDAKKKFMSCFWDARDKLNTVEQYYAFVWNDSSFGISEHEWLRYAGAYKNLLDGPTDKPDVPIRSIPGKIKIVGSENINASYILKLIGEKTISTNGIKTVDEETIRLIYEKIQELSDMGEYKQAQLIKEFVETELIPGKIPDSIPFDDSFDKWKNKRLKSKIQGFSDEWGITFSLIEKTVKQYSLSDREYIPNREEIILDANIERAHTTYKDNLSLRIALIDVLERWLPEIKSEL